MNKMGHYGITKRIVILCLVVMGYPVFADDTCVFKVTADDLCPNIVRLQDIGAGTKQVVHHTAFDSRMDDTPMVGHIKDAVSVPEKSIFSRTSAYVPPVVPAAKTISGDKIYMAFFKPGKENLWEGNVARYGISEDNQIVDAHGDPVMRSNGSMKNDAVAYWSTIDWADVTKRNYIHNSNRNIYTYLTHLTAFKSTNSNLTPAILGHPTKGTYDIIDYIRGTDVFDEDGDGNITENRIFITGDVLHSEPSIFQYKYADGRSETMVYFGSNDGMLHAVLDVTERLGVTTTVTYHGTEKWAFIPPDLLPRLKDMIEGTGHQSYVDSTPGIYFKDIDKDGLVDSGDGDRVILVCGERKGGTGYFALDVTDPFYPKYLWRINRHNDSEMGLAAPTTIISELGETWSVPQFGVVKTTDEDSSGTPVFFIGGGYSSDNSLGKAVVAVNVLTGSVVKKFTSGMNYSFPSTVRLVDENDNGFVDKVYVGDLGGRMWRFASFADGSGKLMAFPHCNENINSWTGHVFFKADNNNSRKFFYPPSVTLERSYDMVFMGTGDRENACCNNGSVCGYTGPDMIAAAKETHSLTTIVGETDLVDVTDPTTEPPDFNTSGKGWYLRLVDGSGNAVGEKVIAEGTVFYKTFYITTFTPNNDPSVPGGVSKLLALSYLTGGAVMDFNNDSHLERMSIIGRGIPSKPMFLITRTGTKLFISVGSADPDAVNPTPMAGVKHIDPLQPPINCFYKYWREIF